MNMFSHMRTGRLLYRYTKDNYGLILDKASFIKGNLIPDFKSSYLKMSHYLENWELPLLEMIRKLLASGQNPKKIDKAYSLTLGVICHFYSDFFCHCHSREYEGGIAAHMRYEWELFMYSQNNYIFLDGTRPDYFHMADLEAISIYKAFKKTHKEYLSLKPSFDNDLKYGFLACANMIAMTAGASASASAGNEAREHIYPALQTI